MTSYGKGLVCLAALLAVAFGRTYAEDGPAPEPTAAQLEQVEAMQAQWDALDRRTGDIDIGHDLATLHVSEDYYFLGPEDSRVVLEDLWGNPPDNGVLGMIFPARYTPFDYESWAVTVEYVEEGHVSDEDAAEIDYAALLAAMQADAREANEARAAAGYEPVELLGWAEPPRYDAASHKLYWAKELRFGDGEETILNYDIRALGRTGVLSMTFIANTSQLAEINASREAVLAMAEFNPGQRYADFDPGIDTVAAYGLGALVAGKVAAKSGMLAGAVLFLKKFSVFILLGLAAFGRKLLGLMRSNEPAVGGR